MTLISLELYLYPFLCISARGHDFLKGGMAWGVFPFLGENLHIQTWAAPSRWFATWDSDESRVFRRKGRKPRSLADPGIPLVFRGNPPSQEVRLSWKPTFFPANPSCPSPARPSICLGVDPGSLACGWAIVSRLGSRMGLLGAGVIRNKSGDDFSSRIFTIHQALCQAIETRQPTFMAVESPLWKRTQPRPSSSARFAAASSSPPPSTSSPWATTTPCSF